MARPAAKRRSVAVRSLGPARLAGTALDDTIAIGPPWPRRPTTRVRPPGIATPDAAVETDVGRVRGNNEDYALIERVATEQGTFAVWAVADGVGGGPQGERASRLAVETVIEYLKTEDWVDPIAALTEAFARANREVFGLGGEEAGIAGAAATTLVVALIGEADGLAYVGNVGDSRAYVVADSVAQPITEDHSVIAARVAAGLLAAAEAREAVDRNVLTRGVGTEPDVLVDVFGPRLLRPGERLVLCTDGLHGMVSDEVIGRLASGLTVADAARALVSAANEAGGRDNVTVIVGGLRVSALPAVVGGGSHIPPRRAMIAGALALLIPLVAVAFVLRAPDGAQRSIPHPSGISPSAGSGSNNPVVATPSPSRTPSVSLSPAPTPSAQRPSTPASTLLPIRTPTRSASPTPNSSQTPTPAPTPSQSPPLTPAPTPSQTPTLAPNP